MPLEKRRKSFKKTIAVLVACVLFNAAMADASGNLLIFSDQAIRLDTDAMWASDSQSAQISSEEKGHIYVVWSDNRNGLFDIYFNYSSDYGGAWQENDRRLDRDAPGAADSVDPRIASDAAGHVYVVWSDSRNGRRDIYFNHSEDYGATWQADDERLDKDAPGAADSYSPQISSDGKGHVYVVWSDYRNGWNSDIYFNYSADHGTTWQANDMRLNRDSAGAADSVEPQVSNDGRGSVYVVWESYRNGLSDIYFNYSRDGGATWQANDQRLDTDAPGATYSSGPRMSSDGAGRVYVVWSDNRNGLHDIYFNFSKDNGESWRENDIRLDRDAPGGAYSFFPHISSDGMGHVYVVWSDNRNGRHPDIYFNRSDDYGTTYQANDMRLDRDKPGAADSRYPQISSDASGHVYVVWYDDRSGPNPAIYFNYSEDYGVTYQANDIRLDKNVPAATGSLFPRVSSDKSGHVYVVWEGYRGIKKDIYFLRGTPGP